MQPRRPRFTTSQAATVVCLVDQPECLGFVLNNLKLS
jgi:hypothetical protein